MRESYKKKFSEAKVEDSQILTEEKSDTSTDISKNDILKNNEEETDSNTDIATNINKKLI